MLPSQAYGLVAWDPRSTRIVSLIASMVGFYLFVSLWPVMFCKCFKPLYQEKMTEV